MRARALSSSPSSSSRVMLRAVRFAAKLGFRFDPATEAPLLSLGDLLDEVPAARLFDESLKLFLSGHAVQSYELLMEHGMACVYGSCFGQYFADNVRLSFSATPLPLIEEAAKRLRKVFS